MSSKDDVTEEQIEFCKKIFGKSNILPIEINKSIYEQSLSVHGKVFPLHAGNKEA